MKLRFNARRTRGFTLLEVLVALTIFAITAAAMHNGIASAVNAHGHMKSKVLANWIAQNIMAETRFMPVWPEVGVSNGDVDMAGRVWYWERKVEATADSLLRRVDIEIRLEQDDEYVMARLSGFVTERPLALSAPGAANLESDGRVNDDPSRDDNTEPVEVPGDEGEEDPVDGGGDDSGGKP